MKRFKYESSHIVFSYDTYVYYTSTKQIYKVYFLQKCYFLEIIFMQIEHKNSGYLSIDTHCFKNQKSILTMDYD